MPALNQFCVSDFQKRLDICALAENLSVSIHAKNSFSCPAAWQYFGTIGEIRMIWLVSDS